MAKPKVPAPKRKTKPFYKSMVDTVSNWYRRGRQLVSDLLFNPDYIWTTGCLLLVAEIVLCVLVVQRVPYTEIDWSTYMQQVELFLNGTRSYPLISGDTGPLPYPAGHLYVYAALYHITDRGRDIRLGQYIFVVFYILNLAIVLRIYSHCKKIPPIILVFASCLSYRVHSIFILRLFNDPLAAGLLYGAVLLLLNRHFLLGCIVYSLAVSIKMNILLYAPAFFVILVAHSGYVKTTFYLFVCALIQLLLGAPFLLGDPMGYIGRAFNLGRVFMFKWTVNWRFLSEDTFTDRRFHPALLAGHLIVLLAFGFTRWLRRQGGLVKVLRQWRGSTPELSANDIVYAMFTSNFIGVMFSRSLHYQFYVWYYHTLPYLLWSTGYSTVIRLTIMGIIEFCWNTYPSTNNSSALLHLCHGAILIGLWLLGSDSKKSSVAALRIQREKKAN